MSVRLWKENMAYLLLAAPAVIYFILFHYLPMLGIVLAFKNFRYDLGIWGSEWVLLDNFKFFYQSQDAWRITRNTLGYSLAFMIVGTTTAVAVALLLNEVKSRAALKYYQTTMILPRFLSWVLVGFITYALLNPSYGVINQAFQAFGMQPVQWYTDADLWPYILIMVENWKSIGLSAIIYYAALLGIDPELYDAAKIDGAGRMRRIWNISLPSLVPIITILCLLSIGSMFSADFGLFYEIPRDIGILRPTTDVIDTYVFRGLRGNDIGITAAVGLLQSVVGLVLIVGSNAIIRKLRPENALF